MSLLFTIIVGIIVGSITGYLLQEDIDTLLISALTGLVGAIIGLAIYTLMGVASTADELISVPGLLTTVIGALILTLLFNALHKAMPHASGKQPNNEPDQSDNT
ncbi:MAG: hypothetical protein JWM81_647 [Candidatus Saccharibacteria bacterium]|nr:hypothetical protein [Candidatus Saccharibacteria bacterium]